MRVDTDFPGGNALVDRVTDTRIEIRPDLRDTIGPWFYWYVRVRECAGRQLTVEVSGEDRIPIGVRGPAVSLDGGLSWEWTGAEAVDGSEFTHTVPRDCDEVRFAFAMPYVAADLERFLAPRSGREGLVRSTLTRSEQGREVELLRLGRTDGGADARVLFTCRHHSCEVMASHVLEGVLACTLDRDDRIGRWLFEHVETVVVPFVDTDGVELGDQGKNRAPHDHGRDYGDAEGIHASVRAIRELLLDRRESPFDVVLDLHCPSISGPTNERIYFVGSPDERNWERVRSLGAELERGAEGPLPYRLSSDLPFGTAWNVAENFRSRDGRDAAQQSISHFLDGVGGVGVHSIIEFPYAEASGVEVNASSARAFGVDLAHAVGRRLQSVSGRQLTN